MTVMRASLTHAFILGILVCSGCDNPVAEPVGSGANGYLPYLQTMNTVRVEYIGQTLLHYYTKQGLRDSGSSQDWWLVRQFEFQNRDSGYIIKWQDSQFTTRACFAMREVDVQYTFESGCGNQSLIRGIYHGNTQTISDLLCMFQGLIGGTDPNNFQSQNASLQTASMEFETASEDSVSFIVRNWSVGSVRPAYNDNEVWTGTYLEKIQLTSFDTLGKQYPPVCRVVFYK
jgi:hypothetical protein